MLDHEQAKALARALEGLTPAYRRVIELRHQDHRPFEEVARRMGLSIASAKGLWFAAIEAMAARLEDRP